MSGSLLDQAQLDLTLAKLGQQQKLRQQPEALLVRAKAWSRESSLTDEPPEALSAQAGDPAGVGRADADSVSMVMTTTS